MTYADAMARFGTDKPDLRMGQELVECTDYFKETPFRVFQAPYVGAVVMPGGAGQPRKQLDAWQEWAKQRGARGLAYVLVQEDGELGGPVAKNLSEEERAGLAAHVGAQPGDCVFFAAGLPKPSRALLGAARLEIGRRGGLIDEDAWSFLWVVDAPLFEPADEATAAGDVAVGGGAWTAVHHAFTSPQDLDTFDKDPGDALAWAYDVVCNGNEIGGGSIRIHREDVQKRVFAVMGIDEAEAQEKFGFLLDAFTFGAPPHGGIAFGWDRITALLARTDSIREVIAFPKSGGGVDPLTAAPAPITAEQRKEAGVDAVPTEDLPGSGRFRLRNSGALRPICYHAAACDCPCQLVYSQRRPRPADRSRDSAVREVAVTLDSGGDGRAGDRLSPTTSQSRTGRSRSRRFAGKSPNQIALSRLRKDKVAVICSVVMLLLVLIAVFAPADHAGCGSTGTSATPTHPTPTEVLAFDGYPKVGPPFYSFTWDHPLGVAPRVGYDNLAYLVYGLRTSLIVALIGHRRLHPHRRRARADGRLLARLGGPDHLVLHRPVPVLPLPAGDAGPGADHHLPLHQTRTRSSGPSSPP